MNAWEVYKAHMSPALNVSNALPRFECSNAVEIHNGIMFDFYLGLPQLWLSTYSALHKSPLTYGMEICKCEFSSVFAFNFFFCLLELMQFLWLLFLMSVLCMTWWMKLYRPLKAFGMKWYVVYIKRWHPHNILLCLYGCECHKAWHAWQYSCLDL